MNQSHINNFFPQSLDLWQVSNPKTVIKKFKDIYLKNKVPGSDEIMIFASSRKDKKYMLIHPFTNKLVHFGSLNHEDHTKHKSEDRRNKYIQRASNIKGNWRDDPYSPNNLSINLLW